MMAIGSYFAFIIIVMGTLLAALHISDEEEQQFFQGILKSHNKYRDLHDSSELYLDEEMCKKAKEIAVAYIDGYDTKALIGNHGTNYFSMVFDSDSVLDPKMVVYTWYQYHEKYNYSTGKSNSWADLFTLIVWKSTQKIGVGIYLKNKMLGVVVTYFPAGNQPGQYTLNVTDPQKTNKSNIQQNDDKTKV